MNVLPKDFNPSSNRHLLLAYVADLELEVDRLRKQELFLRQKAYEMVRFVQPICQDSCSQGNSSDPLAQIGLAVQQFADVKRDLYDPPGYHPAHDQVIAIAVRPLIEQVFRWQQRLHDAPHAALHVELARETIDWFPARLRHVLDNLISNALRYRDLEKGECRVFVGISQMQNALELRVADNGLGMPWDKRSDSFELFYRSLPSQAAGLGVGLAVVKVLIEQCGGSLVVQSNEGRGTSINAVLPLYDSGDFLN